MIFKLFLNIVVCCFIFSAVSAQPDTLLADIKAVEITAVNKQFAVGSRHLQFDSVTLKRYQSSSLSDLLQRQSPLYLKNYGTGTSTISVRGTKAEHTAVLWNGLNISLPTLGLSDFATIPVAGISSVGVQFGPASANYGSASVGGTVLLGSELEFNKGFSTTLQAEAGSFGYRNFSGDVGFSTEKFASRTAVFVSGADNDFPYTDIASFKKQAKKTENAAFKQIGFSQDLEYKVSGRTKVALRQWVTQTKREIQAAMGSNHDHAVQDDENIRLLAELNHLSGFGETTVKAAFFNDVLDYRSDVTESESEVLTYQAQVDHKKALLPYLTVQAGLNAQRFIAFTDGYGTGEKTENRAAAFALLRYDPIPRLHVNLNWRQQWIENYGSTPAPTLAAEFNLLQSEYSSIYIKGNISRSYRVPTLNERFWPPGNKNLNPESGWGHEAGASYQFEKNRIKLTAEATYYHLKINDWIQWLAVAGGWTPVNLQTVVSEGAEISASGTYTVNNIELQAQAAYHLTQTTQTAGAEAALLNKQLIYVPLHAANTFAEIRYKGWFVNGQANFTGKRFTNYANTQAVDGFLVVNAMLGKSIQIDKYRVSVTGKIYNLSNQEYQNVQYRAMPLRNYSLGIRINFIKH